MEEPQTHILRECPALGQTDKLQTWGGKKTMTQTKPKEVPWVGSVQVACLAVHSGLIHLLTSPFGLFIIYNHLQMVKGEKTQPKDNKGDIISEVETELCLHPLDQNVGSPQLLLKVSLSSAKFWPLISKTVLKL